MLLVGTVAVQFTTMMYRAPKMGILAGAKILLMMESAKPTPLAVTGPHNPGRRHVADIHTIQVWLRDAITEMAVARIAVRPAPPPRSVAQRAAGRASAAMLLARPAVPTPTVARGSAPAVFVAQEARMQAQKVALAEATPALVEQEVLLAAAAELVVLAARVDMAEVAELVAQAEEVERLALAEQRQAIARAYVQTTTATISSQEQRVRTA